MLHLCFSFDRFHARVVFLWSRPARLVFDPARPSCLFRIRQDIG